MACTERPIARPGRSRTIGPDARLKTSRSVKLTRRSPPPTWRLERVRIAGLEREGFSRACCAERRRGNAGGTLEELPAADSSDPVCHTRPPLRILFSRPAGRASPTCPPKLAGNSSSEGGIQPRSTGGRLILVESLNCKEEGWFTRASSLPSWLAHLWGSVTRRSPRHRRRRHHYSRRSRRDPSNHRHRLEGRAGVSDWWRQTGRTGSPRAEVARDALVVPRAASGDRGRPRATADAIRLLVRGEFLGSGPSANRRGWRRRPRVGASVRGHLRGRQHPEGLRGSTIATLSKVAATTTRPTDGSAVLLDIGRAQRRQGDVAAATRSFEAFTIRRARLRAGGGSRWPSLRNRPPDCGPSRSHVLHQGPEWQDRRPRGAERPHGGPCLLGHDLNPVRSGGSATHAVEREIREGCRVRRHLG